MYIPNIKIVTSTGDSFDYETPESLGLKFMRVVDDFKDPGKRFDDYSFEFSLPKTKNNSRLFQFADSHGKTNVFKGKRFDVKVFDDSDLLLHGLIELVGFNKDSYKCTFSSLLAQLVDELKGLKLNQLSTFSTINWQYEKTIVNHIRANHLTSDDSDYVHIYAYYQTPFWPILVSDDKEIFIGYKNNEESPLYYSAMPPAFFLVRILENMFEHVGWTMGGAFFQGADLKKIIIPFTGQNEDFSGAIITGGTTTLNLNKLLPDMDCIDFLSSVVNTFKLYFKIDPKSKSISFETDKILFTRSNPYDITNKIDTDSIEISVLDDESTISFTDDGNNNLVGSNNRIFDHSNFNRLPAFFLSTNNPYRTNALNLNETRATYLPDTYKRLWNKTNGTGKDIKIGFSPANYFSYSLLNEHNINGTIWNNAKFSWNYINLGIPFISPQTPSDNNGKVFAEDITTNYVEGNKPSDQDYKGGVSLLYYYGYPAYNQTFTGTSTTTTYKDFLHLGVVTGGTASVPLVAKVPAPIASPYKLLSVAEKQRLMSKVTGDTSYLKNDAQGAEAYGLLLTYYTVGKLTDPYTTTSYSLTLGEDSMFPNLYSEFHEPKYILLRSSHVLKATMRMNGYDWSQMTIDRCLKYNHELYQLVAINGYDPVNQSAELVMLKK